MTIPCALFSTIQSATGYTKVYDIQHRCIDGNTCYKWVLNTLGEVHMRFKILCEGSD